MWSRMDMTMMKEWYDLSLRMEGNRGIKGQEANCPVF
jgi:hypothetical protein